MNVKCLNDKRISWIAHGELAFELIETSFDIGILTFDILSTAFLEPARQGQALLKRRHL